MQTDTTVLLMSVMGAADKAASEFDRRGPDRIHAEKVAADGRAHDIDDGVDGPDFVEMDRLHRDAVDLGLGRGDAAKDGQTRAAHGRIQAACLDEAFNGGQIAPVVAVPVPRAVCVAVLLRGSRRFGQDHVHPGAANAVSGLAADAQFEGVVQAELGKLATQDRRVHAQVDQGGQIHGILRRYGSLVAKMQVPFKAQPAPARPAGRTSGFCGATTVFLPAADSFGRGRVNLATTWVDSAKACHGGGGPGPQILHRLRRWGDVFRRRADPAARFSGRLPGARQGAGAAYRHRDLRPDRLGASGGVAALARSGAVRHQAHDGDVEFSTKNPADLSALLKLNGEWLLTVDEMAPDTFSFDYQRTGDIKINPQGVAKSPLKVGLEVQALNMINKAVESLFKKQTVEGEILQAVYKLCLEGKHINSSDVMVQVDQNRAYFGATQNRLENTISNIEIQAENLQAAESQISDTDVASEMTNFVREQILTQAATAMLSQANSMPKMALQLIQGG